MRPRFTISLERSTLIFSYPQAGRPITPSFGGRADISQPRPGVGGAGGRNKRRWQSPASMTRAGIWREVLEFVRLPLPLLIVRRGCFFDRNLWPDSCVFRI